MTNDMTSTVKMVLTMLFLFRTYNLEIKLTITRYKLPNSSPNLMYSMFIAVIQIFQFKQKDILILEICAYSLEQNHDAIN